MDRLEKDNNIGRDGQARDGHDMGMETEKDKERRWRDGEGHEEKENGIMGRRKRTRRSDGWGKGFSRREWGSSSAVTNCAKILIFR